MLTFSLNNRAREIVDSFTIVYQEHVSKYGADVANEILVTNLYREGYMGSHERGSRVILEPEYFDKMKARRYLVDTGSDLLDNDKIDSYTPLQPVDDQFEDLLDEFFMEHLENVLLASGGVMEELCLEYGFSLSTCFRRPELFFYKSEPSVNPVGRKPVDRVKVFLDALVRRGIEISDINRSKFVELVSRINQKLDGLYV